MQGHLLAQQQKLHVQMEALAAGIRQALPGQVIAGGRSAGEWRLHAGAGAESVVPDARLSGHGLCTSHQPAVLPPFKPWINTARHTRAPVLPLQVHDSVTGAVVEVGKALERRLSEKLATRQDLQLLSVKVGDRCPSWTRGGEGSGMRLGPTGTVRHARPYSPTCTHSCGVQRAA